MTDHLLPQQRRPKTLLEATQDAQSLMEAFNEFAASQSPPTVHSNLPSQEDQVSEPESDSTDGTFARLKTLLKSPDPVLRRKPNLKSQMASQQPTPSMLASLGIKVRDFAYENTLPPVPTVYRQPQQIQPSVPPSSSNAGDPQYQKALNDAKKRRVYTLDAAKKLARTPTEPALEIESQEQSSTNRRQFPNLPRRALETFAIDTPEDSQAVPPLVVDSQPQSQEPGYNGEQWAGSPIVTPNGSLRCRTPTGDSIDIDMINIASDSELPIPALGVGPDMVSYSQMGFSQPDSLASQDDHMGISKAFDRGHDEDRSQNERLLLNPATTTSKPLTASYIHNRPIASSPLSRPQSEPSDPTSSYLSEAPRFSSTFSSPLSSPPTSSPSESQLQVHVQSRQCSPSPPQTQLPPQPQRYHLRKRAAPSPATPSVHPYTRPRLGSHNANVDVDVNKRSVSTKSAHARSLRTRSASGRVIRRKSKGKGDGKGI